MWKMSDKLSVLGWSGVPWLHFLRRERSERMTQRRSSVKCVVVAVCGVVGAGSLVSMIHGCGAPVPPAVKYALSVQVVGSGTVDPSEGTYAEGTVVTVTASPEAGYRVKEWSGSDGDPAAGSDSVEVTMDGDKSVTVQFEPIPPDTYTYTLTTGVIGGNGTVSPEAGTYDAGTEVALTATPDPGYRVAAWLGTNDEAGTANENSVTMTGDKFVVVMFEAIPQVAAPEFDPAGAAFYPSLDVSITCATSGATITYTTDGSDPGESSTPYDGQPVHLTATTTIRAMAYKAGSTASPISQAVFTLSDVPIASFTVSRNGLTVTLDASASSDKEDALNALEARWDFDDDGIWDADWSTGKTVTHMYNTIGTYTIILQIKDTSGRTDRAAQTMVFGWAKGAGGGGGDTSRGIDVLSDSSAIIFGRFKSTATFGAGEPNQTTLTSVNPADMFIAKYGPDGTLQWVKQAYGAGDLMGYGISAFPDGSFVITGGFCNTATFGPGETNETTITGNPTPPDIFVARYNADGTLAWAKSVSGVGESAGFDVVAFDDGSATVMGGIQNIVTFGTFTIGSPASQGAFLAHYDPTGEVLNATRVASTLGIAVVPTRMDAIADKTVVITGYLTTSAIFGPGDPNQTTITPTGAADAFVAKYNPSHVLQWAKQSSSGNSGEQGSEVVIFPNGTSIVTGAFESTATFGGQSITSAGLVDIFVAKYDTNGTVDWVRRAGGLQTDWGTNIARGPAGSVIVAGTFNDTVTFPGQDPLISAGVGDVFVAKYNTDGTVAWSKRAGNPSHDEPRGIASLLDGSSIVTGYFMNTATYGPGEANETSLTSAGQKDIFVAKFNPDGTLAGPP